MEGEEFMPEAVEDPLKLLETVESEIVNVTGKKQWDNEKLTSSYRKLGEIVNSMKKESELSKSRYEWAKVVANHTSDHFVTEENQDD